VSASLKFEAEDNAHYSCNLKIKHDMLLGDIQICLSYLFPYSFEVPDIQENKEKNILSSCINP